MDLFLHIGTEKTGTTSFQAMLKDHPDELKAEGALYSKAMGRPSSRKLSVYARPASEPDDSFYKLGLTSEDDHAEFCSKLEKAFADEVDAAKQDGVKTFLLSSEHLQSRLCTQDMVDRAAALLKPHFDSITVLVVLRPQVDLLLSKISTMAKSFERIELSDFAISPDDDFYNYETLIQRWQAAFGRENVRAFPYKGTKDIVAELLGACGMGALTGLPREVENTRMDVQSIAIANAITRAKSLPPHIVDQNRGVDFGTFPFHDPLRLPIDRAARIEARFAESNMEACQLVKGITPDELRSDLSNCDEEGNIELVIAADWLGAHLQQITELASAQSWFFKARATVADARLQMRNDNLEKVGKTLERAINQLNAARQVEDLHPQADALEEKVVVMQKRLAQRLEKEDSTVAKDEAPDD